MTSILGLLTPYNGHAIIIITSTSLYIIVYLRIAHVLIVQRIRDDAQYLLMSVTPAYERASAMLAGSGVHVG